jgi:hypothetical protein
MSRGSSVDRISSAERDGKRGVPRCSSCALVAQLRRLSGAWSTAAILVSACTLWPNVRSAGAPASRSATAARHASALTPIPVRGPLAREARDLRLLRGQLVAHLDGSLARVLAGGEQLDPRACGEGFGAHRAEHLVCGPQLVASVALGAAGGAATRHRGGARGRAGELPPEAVRLVYRNARQIHWDIGPVAVC